MRILTVMFVTAVCFLFLLKLKWPKNKNIYDNTNTTYNNTLLSKLLLLKILPIFTMKKKKITITYPYTNFDTVALLINTNKRYLLLEKVLNYRRNNIQATISAF